MRYFKYEKDKQAEKESLKKELEKLDAEEKRAYRKAKIMSVAATAVFWTVFILLIIGSSCLVSFIPENGTGVILNILTEVLSVLRFFLLLIVSVVIAFAASLPFWTRSDDNSRLIRQRKRSAICSDLRLFYGLCEPMLVTKCYNCSDKRFNDHDVCLFFVDGELRVTVNLQYGFYNTDKDLGCYAFTKEEFSISYTQTQTCDATEINAGDFQMVLGKRAKAFLEKNLKEG